MGVCVSARVAGRDGRIRGVSGWVEEALLQKNTTRHPKEERGCGAGFWPGGGAKGSARVHASGGAWRQEEGLEVGPETAAAPAGKEDARE